MAREGNEKIWKVAVLGAAGRMGSEAVRAVNTSADMDLVAALGRGDDLQELVDAGAEIVIDLTVPDSSEANVRFAVEHGMHAVVGTTGWTPERLNSLRELLAEHPEVGVLIAPNFAIGSILATEFAAKAARYFESVEIIEIHHPNKVDAPSGTAVHTARKVAAARAEAGVGASPDATTSDPLGSRGAVIDDIHVHAVRLRGKSVTPDAPWSEVSDAELVELISGEGGLLFGGTVWDYVSERRVPAGSLDAIRAVSGVKLAAIEGEMRAQ